MDAKKLLEQVRKAHDELEHSVKDPGEASARQVYIKVARAPFNEAMAHLGGLVTALEVLAD